GLRLVSGPRVPGPLEPAWCRRVRRLLPDRCPRLCDSGTTGRPLRHRTEGQDEAAVHREYQRGEVRNLHVLAQAEVDDRIRVALSVAVRVPADRTRRTLRPAGTGQVG